MSQIIHGKTANFAVSQLVGRFPYFNVYIARDTTTTEEYLLKVASDKAHNGLLDREAFMLSELSEEMGRRNAEHKKRQNTEHGLGYQRCFPRLVESVVVPEQGNRRINIIAVYGATSITDLVPLEQYRTRANVRIDPKSSAWILGRLLKIFTLTHPFGVSAGKVDGGNILVNPKEHHVVLFDWTHARHHNGPLPQVLASEEISQAALAVITALGGDPVTGVLPESTQLPDSRYADFLKRLVDKRVSDPVWAGLQFYGLLDKLWEPSFHPFTTIPL